MSLPPPPKPYGKQAAALASDPDRAAAYGRLLHLQRGCADDPSAAAALAAASSPLLPLLLSDALLAAVGDEAVAALALKCIGFALYHPAFVSTISGEMARSVLDSLVQLIMTTRMKAVCNLGVWCISIQQLEVVIIEDRATSLLTAIVHALDNPFGSLSTTFEAAQAIMKLAGQISKGMRDMSSIWVPPIYRRLLSTDKPERDMAERCLLKVSSIVLPPHSLLSKVVASDLEHNLLPRIMDMLDDTLKKVQAVKSWGWFISLLGSSNVNNRLLLNKMLKVPEKMFIDLDPQVQIAALVAWRNLVDAFLPPQVKDFEHVASANMVQETRFSPFVESKGCSNHYASAQLKTIKLIMVPLCGTLSKSCNIAVRSSCLNTWYYLLHKLGVLINYSSMLETAFGPILKIIFSTGPGNQNMQLWTFCINLFHDFVSSKIRQMASPEEHLCIPLNGTSLSESCMHLKALLDAQPVRWLPWDINCLDFHLEILSKIVNPGLLENMTSEIMIVVMDSAIQMFRLLLRGIQLEFKTSSACNDAVQICISNIFKFAKMVCGDLAQKQNGNKCTVLLQFGLQFVKVIMEELDRSSLSSATCKICLDIEYIKDLECSECHPKVFSPGVRPLAYMEMVSPAVYMTTLTLSMVAQFVGELSQEDAEHLALISCSKDFSENLNAVLSFMYMQIMKPMDSISKIKWLMIWNKTAKGLKEQILSHLRLDCRSGYDVVYQLMCYPFLVFLSPEKMSTPWNVENSAKLNFPLTQDLKMELAIEVYESLRTYSNHGSEITCNGFLEGFCEHLVRVIDENIVPVQANIKYCLDKGFQNIAILYALGEVAIQLLENSQVFDFANQGPKETGKEAARCRQSNLLDSSLELVSRFMRLSILALKANPHAQHQVTNRVFGSLCSFVGHLVLKKDIFLLFQIICDPLFQWLSSSSTLYCEMQQGETVHQLEKLWLQTLECLKRSQLIIDVSFLPIQEPLLRMALNHPHRPISDATTSVWRAATGARTNSRHPQYLVSELDEILADGKKILQGYGNADDAIAREELDISRRFAVSTLEKRKLATNATQEETEKYGESVKISVGLRRKRLKVTTYPIKAKEYRARMIHPGSSSARLDTSVSSPHLHPYLLERKGCRKPELIMEMLRRER